MKHCLAIPAVVAAAVLAGCSPPAELPDDVWRRNAIAYSGYRAGHSPKTGALPSREQVAEDLRILERNWGLIRVYAADRHGEDVLQVIRRENLDLRVMLGIWLDREPGYEDDNARQIADGIRLANAFRDIVVAVNVGNETLIEWTEHPVQEEDVVRYVRQVREAVRQPVTVADNYVWWRDHGGDLAREVDFITMHTYPLWENRDIDQGLSYTLENYEQVRAAHPDKPIVIGEAGWATYTEGNLHVPRGGDEQKQERYYRELTGWARENGVTVFWFEAFDEPWKGTGTEGYWGLFTADRKAKPVMQSLYPDLAPDGPTSPAYPDRIATAGPDINAVLHAGLAGTVPDGSVNPLGPGLTSAEVVQAEGAGGGAALRLAVNGDNWAGVYLMLGKLDAGKATSVSLRLLLPPEVAALELKLEGPDTVTGSVQLLDFETGRTNSGWRTFTVPLDRFDPVDRSGITRIGLWNPSDRSGGFVSGEILVDDLRFE